MCRVLFILLLLFCLLAARGFSLAQHHGNDNRIISTHFSTAEECTPCHENIYDLDENNISLAQDWSASLMSVSLIEPLWQAWIEIEVRRNNDFRKLTDEF